MKITKTQLKQVIKEELRDYYDGESHSQSERDATQPRRPEEAGFQSGPVGGADDIGDAAFQLGRHFGGALQERGEVVANALQEVGASRAAEKLRQGMQSADST